METTFIIMGWFFAITLVLVTFLYFAISNIPTYFPFSRETITGRYGLCKPNWISIRLTSVDDICKTNCYDKYKITSHKIENSVCYCDVSNCNP